MAFINPSTITGVVLGCPGIADPTTEKTKLVNLLQNAVIDVGIEVLSAFFPDRISVQPPPKFRAVIPPAKTIET